MHFSTTLTSLAVFLSLALSINAVPVSSSSMDLEARDMDEYTAELASRGLFDKFKKMRADKKWDKELDKLMLCVQTKCIFGQANVEAAKQCNQKCGEETKKRHPELYAKLKAGGAL